MRRGLLPLAAALLLLAPSAARAQLCGASVTSYVKLGGTINFSAPAHSCGTPIPGACYWIVSPPTGGSRQYQSCSFSIVADQPGRWTWDLASYTPNCHQCADGGSIDVDSACNVVCSAAVTAESPATSLTANFKATAQTVGSCSGPPLATRWTFGDGQESAGLEVTHQYDRIDEYPWTFTASASGITCSKAGTTFLPCLKVGGLGLCGQRVVQDEQDPTIFDIGSMFHVEEVFRSDGSVRFKGSPSGGYGLLSIAEDVWARLDRGREPLVTGKNLLFDVRGSESALHPDAGNPKWLTYSIGGLPLLGTAATTFTFGPKRVDVKSQGWFGVPDLLDLGRLEGTVRMTYLGEDELIAARGLAGNVTPTIQVVDVNMTYDPKTKQASVKTKAGLPFVSGGFKLDATWFFSNCGCGLDGFNIIVPANAIPGTEVLNLLVPGVWGLKPKVSAYRVEAQSICRGARDLLGLPTDSCPLEPPFTLGLYGRLVLGTPFFDIPGEVFRIDNVGLRYRHPLMFTIAGGSAQLLGYTFAEAKGVLSLKSYPTGAYLDGWASAAGLVEGQANLLLSFSRGLMTGTMTGKLQIPRFTCAVQGFACKATKALLEETFGGLPAVATDVGLTAVGHLGLGGNEPSRSELFLRGEVKLGRYRPVVQLTSIQVGLAAPSVSIQAGTSLSSLFSVFGEPQLRFSEPLRTPLSTRTLQLAAPRDVVLFVAEGSTAVPDLTVTDPSGRAVTGRVVTNAEERVAVLEVAPAASGTWTISSSDPGASVDALGPAPVPVTSFSRVDVSGTRASLGAAVAPASPGTTVTFLLGRGAADAAGEPLTEALDASSGSVSAAVELGAVPPGRYVLLALTDDGKNPPVLTAYTEPIVLETEPIRPPTALTGTRSGASVELRWTPSTSQGVAAYTVLYTDRPERGTYAYAATALQRDRATVSGLDVSKEYRFAVQASDAAGASSPESEPWFTSPPPADVVTLARGVAVSGIATAGTLRHFRVSVPTGTSALRVRASGGADPDLYLRQGEKASSSAWDYRSATTGTLEESLEVTATSTPKPLSSGLWYAALVTRAEGPFSIVAELERPGTECAVLASATVPAAAAAKTAVTFAGSAVASRCSGETRWEWDFGDGSPHAATAAATHAYAADGTYAWTLTARREADTSVASGAIAIGGTSPGALPGDCDQSGEVTVDELQRAVNMALGAEPAGCGADTDHDGLVSDAELAAVLAALLRL